MLKKILLSLIAILSLTACSEQPQEPVGLNSTRTTTHKYDFVQFIDVNAFGPNGSAMLEIKPKDITIEDFETEDEYIKVKKTVDKMKLYIVPGENKESNLVSDKVDLLKNGDIITLSIKDSYTDPGFGADINLEPFQIEIQGLQEAIPLDLYDTSSIEFYGLEGTTDIVPVKKAGGKIPSNILNNIEYTASPDSTKLEAGKTIITINSEMKNEFLTNPEDPYYTTDIFLRKNGYSYNLTEEKVLQKITGPMDFSKIKQEDISSVLYNSISEQNLQKGGKPYYLDSIATIQKSKENSGRITDPYTYIVTSLASNEEGEQMCVRNTVKMAKFDNNINILSINNPENIQMDYCGKAYDSTDMLINFNVVDLETPEPTEEPAQETE